MKKRTRFKINDRVRLTSTLIQLDALVLITDLKMGVVGGTVKNICSRDVAYFPHLYKYNGAFKFSMNDFFIMSVRYAIVELDSPVTQRAYSLTRASIEKHCSLQQAVYLGASSSSSIEIPTQQLMHETQLSQFENLFPGDMVIFGENDQSIGFIVSNETKKMKRSSSILTNHRIKMFVNDGSFKFLSPRMRFTRV